MVCCLCVARVHILICHSAAKREESAVWPCLVSSYSGLCVIRAGRMWKECWLLARRVAVGPVLWFVIPTPAKRRNRGCL